MFKVMATLNSKGAKRGHSIAPAGTPYCKLHEEALPERCAFLSSKYYGRVEKFTVLVC